MKIFAHHHAHTVAEAVKHLKRYNGRAHIIAGGTDILGKMKDQILPDYPEALININTIPDFDLVKEEKGFLSIGPLAILEDIAEHPAVKQRYRALSQAARLCASPHLREMGTIGGNLCQDIRCWFYRHPNNRFPCLRKGGGRCYAIEGDHRYHSIFGGSVEEGCYAVHPSDTAPALIALNAVIHTSKRKLAAEDLFQVDVSKTTVLDNDEIITEIAIPHPERNTQSAFNKYAMRKSIDFPIVNCAVMVCTEKNIVMSVRVCLNAVYVKPYRAIKAEEALIGKKIDSASASAAADAAVSEAQPLHDNVYMVEIVRTLLTDTLLEFAGK